MTQLDGFIPFDFSEGVPYASVTNNGITFNKSVVKKLGCPNFVVLLINRDDKKIAVQCCSEETQNSVTFYKPRKNDIFSVRWNGKDLLNTIQDITGWDLKQDSYRVEGILLRDEKAMLFDLNKASLLK